MSLRFGLFAILFALLGCRVSAQDIAPQSSSPPASSTSEHSQADTTADRQVETSNPTISAQHVGAGLSAPKVTQSPEPEYPEEARRAGYQGTVTLRLIVDAQGKPQKIKVQRSLGMGLDEQAVEAVKQWRFEPAKKDGVAVALKITMEINFHLYDGLAPHPESSGEPPRFPGVNLAWYPLILRVQPAYFDGAGSGYSVNYKAEFMNDDKPSWQIISCLVASPRCLPLDEGTYPGRWQEDIMGKLEILGVSKDKGKNWTEVEYSPIAISGMQISVTGCLKRGSEGSYVLTNRDGGDNWQLWSNSVNLAEHVGQVVSVGGKYGQRRPTLPLARTTYRLAWEGDDGQQHQSGTTETDTTPPPILQVRGLDMVGNSCTR
ncbi:MAG: energy transducer TonB [Candidatus Korobacteraceae bacterium]|jgi:TonB family protein